jgi:hypothetical protein
MMLRLLCRARPDYSINFVGIIGLFDDGGQAEMQQPKNRADRREYTGIALWAAAIAALVLFALQYVMADGEVVTLRYVVAVTITGGAALVARRSAGERIAGRAPDPASLVLGGLAALGVWPMAWWLMDLTNYILENAAGWLPRPQPVIDLPDALLGLSLQPAVYEIGVVFAVVVAPLVQAWLLWGEVLPELESLLGNSRGVWATGVLAGCFWALTSPQNITPALPWGLSSAGGYILVGCVAAWSTALVGSAWAGFAAQFVFAYASLAWTDDLFRELGRKSYWDLAWLTVILLGLGGAVRARTVSRGAGRGLLRVGLPLAVVAASMMIMAALDVAARQDEAAASQPAQEGHQQSQQP